MEFKVGEKVALLGGGNARNVFHVVIYRGRINSKQVRLETNPKDLPNPFTPFVTEKVKGLPLGGSSWSLAKLEEGYENLPLGRMCINGNEIIDITEVGIFGSILHGKVVKKVRQ